MHAPCMHACKYMNMHPPHTSTLIHINRYTQKYIDLWLWPKRPPMTFYMAEMSVAKMSWSKCPWPKRPWPKYPTFLLTGVGIVCQYQTVSGQVCILSVNIRQFLDMYVYCLLV